MSTPTVNPPAWLDAAAKLDSLLGDKVPLTSSRSSLPPTDLEDEEKPRPPAEIITIEAPPPPKAKPRSRIATATRTSAASTEEVDLAWHGYSSLTLLPSTVLLAATSISAVIWLRPLVPAWIVNEAVDAPLAACWLLQAVRGLYRMFAFRIRLTNRRLFRERGQLYASEKPLDLAMVVRAEVKQNLLERMICVGSVHVIAEESKPSVELTGIRRPKAFAELIEEAVKAARDGNVVAMRVEA